MELTINTRDPLEVLMSTKTVVENSKFVTLNQDAIPGVIEAIANQLKSKGLDTPKQNFRTTDNFENNVQLVFIEDALNFCFWAKQDDTRWQIEWPQGHFVKGGWHMLTAALRRALDEGVPLLDPRYLKDITIEDIKSIFRSANDLEIPLVEERMTTLHEVGRGLISKFDGHFKNVVIQSGHDAIELAKLIILNFPSFRDVAVLGAEQVKFYARAQICANDISALLRDHNTQELKNLDQLTAFANYKLSQMLRMFGVIKYTDELDNRVDTYTELPQGSREEVEIRAATVWAMELIHQQMSDLTVVYIDNALWLAAQDLQIKSLPYHRTETIYY